MVKELANMLIWKSKDREIEITSLKDLLNILVDIKQEDIGQDINLNLGKLILWLEKNFPRQIDLSEGIKQSIKEFTPQQMREMIIRKLRKII